MGGLQQGLKPASLRRSSVSARLKSCPVTKLFVHFEPKLRTAAEAVRLLEFVAKGRATQILANVLQALLEGEQRFFYGCCVGGGDIAPHRERAGAEAGHLAERASAYVFEFRRVADLFVEKGAERGGRELRQVADPCNHLVVASGVDVDGAGTHGEDEFAPFFHQGCAGGGTLPGWVVGEEPDGIAKEIGVGEFCASAFLACHGVAGEKRCALRSVEEARGGRGDLPFGAAH